MKYRNIYTLLFHANAVIAPKLEIITYGAFFLIYIEFPTRCNFSFWKRINSNMCDMQKKIRNLKIMYLKSNYCLLLLTFSSSPQLAASSQVSLGGMPKCREHLFHMLSRLPGPFTCCFACVQARICISRKKTRLSLKTVKCIG